MAPSVTLKHAVREARRIRQYLVQRRTGIHKNLYGDCGYASLLLAYAVKDISILRAHPHHAWAEVKKIVIDITATQFDNNIRGVYIGPPAIFHIDGYTLKRGRSAAREIIDWGGYGGWYLWDKVVDWVT